MPVDTRSKRASSVNILLSTTLALVLPDGTISWADRQHTAWSYSGIRATPGLRSKHGLLGSSIIQVAA